jgi:hypothetical protein
MCNVPLERYSRGDAMRDAVAALAADPDAFRPQMVFFRPASTHREAT